MTKPDLLRVVHVAEDMSAVSGGVPSVVRQLSGHLVEKGIHVEIAHASGDPDNIPQGIKVATFRARGAGRAWSWSRGLRAGLAALVRGGPGKRSVFHVHGIWSAPQYFAARSAYAARTPFVLSSHGMLEPWLWNEQGRWVRFKKRRYWELLAYSALSKASVIHAITPLERDHLAELFPGKKIEVIPNAIEVAGSDGPPRLERAQKILFLGRIEPKKGVDLLLKAFADASIGRQWILDIVGPVWSQTYLNRLKAIVADNGLGERVRFRGPVFGREKSDLVDRAWVMAVPSRSEVVGLVNLEAGARYLPTITTRQTGLHDWEAGGGLLIEPNVEQLGIALEMACSWTAQEQRERGEASRRLIERRYSWQKVLPMWIELYSSL